MGYTHYWTPKKVTEDKFKEFASTCKKLHKALPMFSESAGSYYKDEALKICGGLGTGKPLFRNDEVWFNGDETLDLDNETFCIEPDKMDWDSCKTAHKPYDILVVACLIAAHEILGYKVTSDGRFGDWKEGIKLYMDTVYGEMPNEEGLKAILPEFLFDGQGGDEWEEPYNVFDYIKSLFVVVD